MEPDRFRAYLASFAGTAVLVIVLVLVVNLAVDPLWYFQGNRLFDRNYAFNERYSKTVRYMKDPKAYDCLIFGSSRTTLLDAGRIAGHRCFNFAISDGVAEEFVLFARYAEKWGRPPDLVITAVDDFAIDNYPEDTYVPDFVRALEPPPSALKSYASLSTLGFSLRTLMRQSPFDRFYRSDFTADFPPPEAPYDPSRIVDAKPEPPVYSSDGRVGYRMLRTIFPEARFVGYVPPISLWTVARMEQAGTLDGYLGAVFDIARVFDAFYDFSVPSAVTADRMETYDGSHYSLAVNARIAERLNGGPPGFGMALHLLSSEEYDARFRKALSALSDRHDIDLPAPDDTTRTAELSAELPPDRQ